MRAATAGHHHMPQQRTRSTETMAPAIVVDALRFEEGLVTGRIREGNQAHTVTFRVSSGPLFDGADPWVPVSLLSGMRTGYQLMAPGPVSPKLLKAMPEIQRRYRDFYPDLREVSIVAEPRQGAEGHRAAGVAALFSAGVDSFYTALKHQRRLSCLIFGRGLSADTPPAQEAAAHQARAAASDLGLPLLEVTTDLRAFSDRYASWERYHGAGLASVALLLAPQIRTVFLPGWICHGFEVPFGSHPLLDPLWSTELVEICYDGFEANRFEKVASIAQNDAALRHLRVCTRGTAEVPNCGTCEKCLRTMVALEAAGVLARCSTFPSDRVDPEAVAALVLRKPTKRAQWEQNLRGLESAGSNPQLARAVRQALTRNKASSVRRLVRALRRRRRAPRTGRSHPVT